MFSNFFVLCIVYFIQMLRDMYWQKVYIILVQIRLKGLNLDRVSYNMFNIIWLNTPEAKFIFS